MDDLGSGYKNEKACATFVDFISLGQQRMLVNSLDRARFFGLQLDGSANARNVEKEVFLVVFCGLNSKDGKVHMHNNFLTASRLGRANATGLLACLRAAVGYVGVANWELKMIGVGCDGANVNLGTTGGLKGLLTKKKSTEVQNPRHILHILC